MQALELTQALQRVRSSHRRREGGGDERRQGRRTRSAHGEWRSRSSEGEGGAGGVRGERRKHKDDDEKKEKEEKQEGQALLGRISHVNVNSGCGGSDRGGRVGGTSTTRCLLLMKRRQRERDRRIKRTPCVVLVNCPGRQLWVVT